MTPPLDHLRAAALSLLGPAAGERRAALAPGLSLVAADRPAAPFAALYGPMASLVLGGEMEVTIGAAVLSYAPGTCFVGSIDLPVTGRITRASAAAPWLALHLRIDREELSQLIADAPRITPEPGKCYALGPATAPLLEAAGRLLAVAADPEERAVLGPLIRREILYRLLRGPQAAAMHRIAASDPKLAQIRRSLTWIRENLAQSVPVADMAACAGMSEPSFRRHFRSATGMSPLQYQKTLRLQAARRAVLSGEEIARAGFAVGYESASQFSREYARMFGLPPSKDAARLRDAAPGAVDAG